MLSLNTDKYLWHYVVMYIVVCMYVRQYSIGSYVSTYMCFILASKTCDYDYGYYSYKWCPRYDFCDDGYFLCDYPYGCGYNSDYSRCCK